MTLAAVRKMASRLTPAQRRKLGRELLAESAPQLRPNASLDEIQRRADEMRSGKAKTLSWAESQAGIDRLMIKLRRERSQKRRSVQ